MSRASFVIVAVLGLPLLIAAAVYGQTAFDLVFHRRPPERFLIPAGYSGWVRVDFRQKDAPPLPMEDGRRFGEALLDPSVIYVRFIAAMQEAGMRPHYAVHITGHGWRKLMRLAEPFVYRIEQLSPHSPATALFQFIQRAAALDDRERVSAGPCPLDAGRRLLRGA